MFKCVCVCYCFMFLEARPSFTPNITISKTPPLTKLPKLPSLSLRSMGDSSTALPFLPGYTFTDPAKSRFHR